jgi:signal transduction histidine kinase
MFEDGAPTPEPGTNERLRQMDLDLRHAMAEQRRMERVAHQCHAALREMASGRQDAALQKALEHLAEVQEARIRVEKLAAVGQLAASVGHDLRNPLAAARNALHYLGRRLEGSPELSQDRLVAQSLGVMDKELRACTRIIGDLLDFARERPVELSACPLRPLVADAFSVVQPPRPTRLVNDVPDDLPVPALDRDQFRQVLVNLAQNATEAIPPDREGEVRIGAAITADEIQVWVKDNGSGIPEELRQRIFEPLFTTKTRGIGLGLAIVLGLVRRHGGTVELQTAPGLGTTFTLRLPRNRPEVIP